MCKDFKPTKPRSMVRVMSDIEYLIANKYDREAILTDIAQLKSQLGAVESALNKDNEILAVEILNPAMKYYYEKQEKKLLKCNWCSDEIDPFKAVIKGNFPDKVFCSEVCADDLWEKNSN
jgi:hypothetical protein